MTTSITKKIATPSPDSKRSTQEKSKNQLSKNELVHAKKKTFFDDYWRTIPHVPDSEYYCHGD